MEGLDKVPAVLWASLAAIAGAVAWIVSVVVRIEDRFVRKEEAVDKYPTKAELSDKYLNATQVVQLLTQAQQNRDQRCKMQDETIKLLREDLATRAEVERRMMEVEREAVHQARTELQAAVLRHEQKPGHAGSLEHINKIETAIAVMTQVQSDQKEILRHHGELLEEIRSTVRSNGHSTGG